MFKPKPSNKVEIQFGDGQSVVLYEPQPKQQLFHQSETPNLLALGTRNTGKSTQLRWCAFIRCMTYPGFKALLLRRKMTDLRKSHLNFVQMEVGLLNKAFPVKYRETTYDVRFGNNSLVQFGHCEDDRHLQDYLSSEWDYIGFDELVTFSLEQFLLISAAARSAATKPYKALVRACSNPFGSGAPWMYAWFVDKDVDYGDYPDYVPADFEMQFSTMEDNRYVNKEEYEKRLKNLPAHVKRAWLYGERVIEGVYFEDFKKTKEVVKDNGERIATPWHVISDIPYYVDPVTGEHLRYEYLAWAKVYRSLDWGYFPDPWVCLWHLVLPNKRVVTFKSLSGKRELAKDVADKIKQESRGMNVPQTFCDPTMFVKTGETSYSIGEIFEQNGVPLTPAQNDRELYGYALHEGLNEILDDGLPKWQILEYSCKDLVRTIPIMQMDTSNPKKIADGEDHWVVAAAYFWMGAAPPSRDPGLGRQGLPRWMMPKSMYRRTIAVG